MCSIAAAADMVCDVDGDASIDDADDDGVVAVDDALTGVLARKGSMVGDESEEAVGEFSIMDAE